MPFADSNRAGLRYIEEVSFGTTPASGVTKALRFTSSSLAAAKETVVSDELRSDRMVSSVAEVAASSGGDVNFELAAGTIDDFLEAFLAGDWTTDIDYLEQYSGTIVSWTGASTLQILGQTPGWVNGDTIMVKGFPTPANNGYFTVDSVSGDTVTVNETSATAEAGTANVRVFDASDAIVTNDTTISVVAATNTFSSSVATKFQSAIAAGLLTVGQRIFVEGLGRETGTVEFTATASLGDIITVNDGEKSYQFVAGTDFEVGASATDSATNFANALNAKRAENVISVNASAPALDVVTLTNMLGGGGSIAATGAGQTVSAFSGGQTGVRGVFTVGSLADDGITVVEDLPGDVSAGAAVTIKASMLRNPAEESEITNRSFSFEQSHADVGQYFNYQGQRVGSLSLEVATGSIVSGSFTLGGLGAARRAATTLNTAPYTPKATAPTEVMNATTNVGSLVKNGTILSTAIQSISLEGQANLRSQNAVSSKFPRGIGLGRLNITGTVTAYFETGEMWDHFANHDTVSLAWDFEDIDGNTYWFTMPALKFASDPVSPGGIDQDVVEEMEFMSFRDATTECQMQIDRFSSLHAV